MNAVSNTIFEVEAPKSEILQPALAPASVESTPMKQKHPRKVQELDKYFWLPNWQLLHCIDINMEFGIMVHASCIVYLIFNS